MSFTPVRIHFSCIYSYRPIMIYNLKIILLYDFIPMIIITNKYIILSHGNIFLIIGIFLIHIVIQIIKA